MRTVVWVLLALTSCDAKKDRCKEIVAPALERSLAKAAGQSPKAHDRVEILEAIAVWRCAQDKWSSDSLDCYNRAASPADLRDCRGKLLADQADKFERQARLSGAPTNEDALAMLAELRNQMCACKAGDPECTRNVQKQLGDYSLNHDLTHMSEEEAKEAADISAAMTKCAANAAGSDAPPAPADKPPF